MSDLSAGAPSGQALVCGYASQTLDAQQCEIVQAQATKIKSCCTANSVRV